MILDFKVERRAGLASDADPVLRNIRGHWEYSREAPELPSSGDLFLSDLVDEMAHVVLAYQDDNSFWIEFAGEAATRLLGIDPIGVRARKKSDLPPAVGRSIRKAAETREPTTCFDAGLHVLCLPYGSESGDVDLVLVGVAGAVAKQNGKVISLGR